MTKIVKFLHLFCFVLLALYVSTLWSQKKKTQFSFISLYNNPVENVSKRAKFEVGIFSGYVISSDRNYDCGLSYGVNAGFLMTKNIALELRGLRYLNTVKGEPDGLSKGRLTDNVLQLHIQIRFFADKKCIPYIAGGVGYHFFDFTMDSEITGPWDALGVDISEEVKDSLGYHIEAGLDLFLSEKFSLNGGCQYMICDINGNWRFVERSTRTQFAGDIENIQFNAVMFSLGLKYYF